MKFVYGKKSSPSNKTTKIILWVIAVIFLAAAVGWFSLDRWYQSNLEPVSISQENVVVVIPSGSSTSGIAKILSEAGLIKNTTAFGWYVDRLDDERLLQAGTYTMSPSLSVSEIVEILLSGKVDTSLVTIVPGLRLDEIEEDLVGAGFDRDEVVRAFALIYDHPLLDEKPKSATLEGYIYPETYQITAETTVVSLLVQAFSVFSERIDARITQGIARQGLTLHEAFILASIVQEEVSSPEDQEKVAQVFLRRLEENLPLGADPTFKYAAAITGQEPSVDIDSPYNTRIVTGLPPGPIANFNLSALQAVANPSDTDYLYFVSGDDGNTYFSKTFAEHQANVDKYCKELCKL
ncbi:MAG: endolytic transglycosylase MltG [Candidatus Saccharimonadales bacterium]|nr:endolytic transglycosylase MltG [Candidatus Saccharimonadales bacterium]